MGSLWQPRPLDTLRNAGHVMIQPSQTNYTNCEWTHHVLSYLGCILEVLQSMALIWLTWVRQVFITSTRIGWWLMSLNEDLALALSPKLSE